jgi:hypothetical protein
MALGKLFSAANDYKSLMESKTVMLRAYYFEIQANLDLLEVINKDKLSGLTAYSKAVKSIVNNLEMPIASSIMFSENAVSKEIFNLFNTTDEIMETDENDNLAKKIKKTPLQIINFILRKITILQKLSLYEGDQDEDIINTMRLKVRIENIRTHLQYLQDYLKKLDEKEKFLIQ